MRTPTNPIESVNEYEPGPGDIVVLRRLKIRGQSPGPKIGQIVRELGGGRWRVKLYQGSPFRRSSRFAKIGRDVEAANIDRLATPRERTLGAVVDHTVVVR